MAAVYTWKRLDPSAASIPSQISPCTLGIEVTDAPLAALCDLGNIDPQHGFARGPAIAGRAAIDVALGWRLPVAGATLATIRPDADSIGAMAVLSLRAEGAVFAPPMLTRVELVARSDCFDYGDWASWAAAHPPPVIGQALLALSPHPLAFRVLAAAIGQCTGSWGRDDLLAAVSMMGDWLLTGRLPARGESEVRTSDKAAAMAWADGQLPVASLCRGAVATVRSDYPGAMALGYRTAPIVVAERQLYGKRKITIAQFERGHLDMAALARRLNTVEPGWGGSETILGSPQNASTSLEIGLIIGAIEETGAIIR